MADPANPAVQWPGGPENNRGFYYPSSGPNNAIEYVASGLPFSQVVAVTSSAVSKVDFPFVTSEVYVKNRGTAEVSVGWTANGVQGTNKHVLLSNEAISFRVRVKSIFFVGASGSANVDLTAALTTIPKKSFPVLTGSAANPVSGGPSFGTGSLEPNYGYSSGLG